MTRRTSRDSYNKIKSDGLLTKLKWDVYQVLYRHGPLTQGEVWSEYFKADGYQRHSIAPRFAELEKMGVIESIGERPCRFSKVNSMIWDVTPDLPVKINKTRKKPVSIQRENEACALIADEFNYKTIAAKIRERMT